MRITFNPPCKLCSPDNIQKHCFGCGRCRIEFKWGEITYNGIEYGLCSEKCRENYIKIRHFSKHKWYGYWFDY